MSIVVSRQQPFVAKCDKTAKFGAQGVGIFWLTRILFYENTIMII